MAIQQDITADDMFFIGEDKALEFEIFELDNVTPADMTGKDLRWDLRRTDKASDPALITKTNGIIGGITLIGAFNINPLLNAQRVHLSFADTDTNPLKPRTYRHSLKVITDTIETVLAFGNFVLRQATVR